MGLGNHPALSGQLLRKATPQIDTALGLNKYSIDTVMSKVLAVYTCLQFLY